MTEVEFVNEAALVQAFLNGVSGSELMIPPFAPATVIREFFYARGRTDIVFVSDVGEVVAVEAKLIRWRDALTQAYRNTCFAHRSFVVLPWRSAQLAGRYSGEFERRGVGLCAVRNGTVVIMREADWQDPIEPWLSSQARRRAATPRPIRS
jgi:hypothetical protein